MKLMKIENLLAVNKYVVDKKAHIHLDKEKCLSCPTKPCMYACPAGLYQFVNQEMKFDYAGCLECGTCRVVCADKSAITWQYPDNGNGIVYRFG